MNKYQKKTETVTKPLIEIDQEQLEKLAGIGCTNDEMAAWFNCSKDTLENRFSAIIAKGRGKMRASLRRMQWISANSGNVQMQIWLGKMILGQRENDLLDIGDEDQGTTIIFTQAKKLA